MIHDLRFSHDRRGFYARTRRQGRGMHVHLGPDHERAVRRDFFSERRRRRTGIGQVLVTMPRTSDAPVDYLSFAERPVLMLTNIGNRGDLSVVAEDGDSL